MKTFQKMMPVCSDDNCKNENAQLVGDLVSKKIMEIIIKSWKISGGELNIMLIFKSNLDIKPFCDRYLQHFDSCIFLNNSKYYENLSMFKHRMINLLLTNITSAYECSKYADIVIFADYLPQLDDYMSIIKNIRNEVGLCFIVYNQETIVIDEMVLFKGLDRNEEKLERYNQEILKENNLCYKNLGYVLRTIIESSEKDEDDETRRELHAFSCF